MSAFQHTLLFAACAAMIHIAAAQAPAPPPAPDAASIAVSVAKAIEAKYAAAQQYTFDATLELARKTGEESREVVATYKVKVAVAAEGRYLLWVSDKNQLEYLIVSDGRDAWAYMPGLNKYARLGAVDPYPLSAPEEIFVNGVGDESRDPILCSKLVLPILTHLTHRAALTEMTRLADVAIAGEDRQFPILSVLSEKDEHEAQVLTNVVLDPETLDLVQVEWTRSATAGEEQRFVSLKIEFEKLRIGDPIPASYFLFNPPGDAQLVDDLPISSLNGSAILNQPAPDFELATASGSKTRLSGLRGHAVLLGFSGSGCAACSQQLAELANIQAEYKDKGLVVLGIGAEPKSATALPGMLVDHGAAVHRSYRVQLAPAIVVIDAQGKVVRFLPGVRDAAAIKAALKSAGL
jgi:peroxiredoxin/outer membrane lipoprotein-sorting protein